MPPGFVPVPDVPAVTAKALRPRQWLVENAYACSRKVLMKNRRLCNKTLQINRERLCSWPAVHWANSILRVLGARKRRRWNHCLEHVSVFVCMVRSSAKRSWRGDILKNVERDSVVNYLIQFALV